MNISANEKDGRLYYRISDYGQEFEKVLIEFDYINEKGFYQKSFPLPIANQKNTIDNYLRLAEKMLNEAVSKEHFRWEESLRQFAAIAKEYELDWWTCGRTALAIRGVDLEVNDLDFVFPLGTVDTVNEAFKNFIVEPVVSTDGTHRSNWVKQIGTAYSHCKICLAFEPYDFVDNPEPTHFGPYAASHLETVLWNGISVKAPSVELHLKTYERWGKTSIVNHISQYLSKQIDI